MESTESMDDMLPDDIDIKRLRLKPGDVVVLRVNMDLTLQEADRLKAIAKRVITINEVLVIDHRIDMWVMEP